VKQENREKDAALFIQRVFRGHIGRKAGRRWAMKHAELNAMFALFTVAAITAQRIFRGYKGNSASRARVHKYHVNLHAIADRYR